MADVRVCHHQGFGSKFCRRIPSALVPRRGRSRAGRTSRKSSARPPAESSATSEPDLPTEAEGVKRTVPAADAPFNWTAWKSSRLVEFEPLKYALSELSFMILQAVPDANARGARKPLAKGTGVKSSAFHLSQTDREKVCNWIAQMQSDSKDGVDSSVTCEVPSNDGNAATLARASPIREPAGFGALRSADCTLEAPAPGGAIGPEKSAVSCLEDTNSQLMVIIPLLEVNGEQKKGCKKRKSRRRKKAIEGPKLDKYLDTNVIDRYMEQIWKKLPEDKQESCTYLDCLWFSMYLEDALSLDILKWTKAKRIFSKRYVFVPIVHWSHWNLLILCHFGEDCASQTRTPCMLLLDSLKETDPRRLEPLIRKFVMEVHKLEGRHESEKIISSIPLLVPEVPQQTNGNDCGVFVLHFIDLFLKCAPENFSMFEGYPYFLTKDWFKSREIAKRRRHIFDVCLNEEDCVRQKTNKRISTRSKRLHGLVNSDCTSNWIDLSSAA